MSSRSEWCLSELSVRLCLPLSVWAVSDKCLLPASVCLGCLFDRCLLSASESRLQAALIRQAYQVLDIGKIFPPDEMFPDVRLENIFTFARKRFFKRTSSAQWDTPPKRP